MYRRTLTGMMRLKLKIWCYNMATTARASRLATTLETAELLCKAAHCDSWQDSAHAPWGTPLHKQHAVCTSGE
jgi:hypothetical protein